MQSKNNRRHPDRAAPAAPAPRASHCERPRRRGRDHARDPAAPATRSPDQIREDFLRRFVELLRVPARCELKPCRRSGRCVGPARGAITPCFRRYRAELRPILAEEVTPLVNARQLQLQLEDKF